MSIQEIFSFVWSINQDRLIERPKFEGITYDPAFDATRLNRQLRRVYELMRDGEWRTLNEIATATGDQCQSISARLRDFRKKPHRWTVNRRRRGKPEDGIFEYQLQC